MQFFFAKLEKLFSKTAIFHRKRKKNSRSIIGREKRVENTKNTKLLAFILTFGLLFKVYLTRILIFEDYNLLNLFVKETWIVLLLLLIFVLAKNNKREIFFYFTINIGFTLLLLTLVTYFNYYGNIITYKALLQVNQIGGIKLSIIDLLEPVSIFFFMDMAIVLFLRKKGSRLVNVSKLALFGAFLFAVAVSLYGNTTQNVDEIVNENIKAQKMGLFNYQVYAFVSDQIITANAGPADIGAKPRNEDKLNVEDREYFGIAKDKNVIYVQLEAVQNFPIGLQVDGIEITPNLNKFIKESTYFPNFYQQIGTGTTSDAEFVTATSVHPIGDVAMSYSTKDAELASLPKILNGENYETMTFHTNDVQFWDRNLMYNTLDYDRYYDVEYFGEEDFISFGSSDEILYEKTLPELVRINEEGKNFYASIVAMSSHHPYSLPEEYHQIKLPEEYNDTKLGKYLIAVNYADYAFGQFIEGLKANGLYDDTLLVVYGDHYALPIEGDTDIEHFEEIVGRPYSDLADKYNVPLIIKMPGQTEAKTVDLVGGQVDTLPTVLNLLGIDPNNYHLYGKDLLNNDDNLVPIRYYIPSGSFVNNEVFYIPGEKFEDGYAIDIKTREQVEDISQYKDEYMKAVELLKGSDYYVKNLPLREGVTE